MRYALTAAQMKAADKNTIDYFGVASLVLQERAALAVCAQIINKTAKSDDAHAEQGLVYLYAGCGNNGADALACARLLHQRGFRTRTRICGKPEKGTSEFHAQLKSVKTYGLDVAPFDETEEKNVSSVPACVLDGLLGVGLSRAPEGAMEQAIRRIHALKEAGAYVIAIDLPSGLNADDGSVFPAVVQADLTVTFGFAKAGQLLYPGAGYCGRLLVADIGITEDSLRTGEAEDVSPDLFYYGSLAETALPVRKPDGNKGTFGKLLLIVGSEKTGGAAILAASSALKSGCGMVRVFTAKENRDALLAALPEALIDVYDASAVHDALPVLQEALSWCDAVLCGCGTGTGKPAQTLLDVVLENRNKPLVLDADALNILADETSGLWKKACAYADDMRPLLITPHMGEFARLCSRAFDQPYTVTDCKHAGRALVRELAICMNACVLCKDARSIAADPEGPFYINISGNDGMATAGSGDVLAGLLGALLAGAYGKNAFQAVCDGAYLHGLAGDLAAKEKGKHALTASDLGAFLERILHMTEKDAQECGFVASYAEKCYNDLLLSCEEEML